MQCAFDALQIEEYIARYHVSFRRSWFRDWQGRGHIYGSLLTTQVRSTAGIDGNGDDLLRKVKIAFDPMNE
jgi:hypothetical protein